MRKKGGCNPPQPWPHCSGETVEDPHVWVPMFNNGGSGALDDDGIEDNDHWLRGGGPLSIDEKDERVGGVMGVNNNCMGHPTATNSASNSSTNNIRAMGGCISCSIHSKQ
jgi:hypothetical protein